MSEKPRTSRPRRLRDWLNPTGARKVHSLVDKVYKPKNLAMAWDKVRRNKGAGGVDGETLKDFEAGLEERLARRPGLGQRVLGADETRGAARFGQPVDLLNLDAELFVILDQTHRDRSGATHDPA